ncbi:MAG: ABC transporter permease [Rudaea sp.]
MFDNFIRNIRQGTRSLAARPGFTLTAILTLAIGIGASTTLFGTIDTLLLAPVRGVGAPQNLVELGGTIHGDGFQSFSYPDFKDLRARAKPFADIFAYRLEALDVDVAKVPQRALGLLVSGNYFSALQVPAAQGRLLGQQDDQTGAGPVAVATYAAWQKYFNGDADVVGKPVMINGHEFTLVGVAAAQFHGTIALISPEFYVPVSQRPLLQPSAQHLLDQRESLWLSLGARLASHTTSANARTQLSAISGQLASMYPHAAKQTRVRDAIAVVPLRGIPAEMRTGLLAFSGILFVLVSLVLLVACVNVASVLLARGEMRRHDIAIRFALGASRRHVFAQLLTESALLSLVSGGLGALLGVWCCRLLGHMHLPTPVPVVVDIPLSASALLFALACTAVTTLVFGLLPALRISARAPSAGEALAGRQVVGARSRLASALIVAQVALTMVLLVAGGLFARALERAAHIDPGFDAQHVLAADFNLEPSGYSETRQRSVQQQFLERVRNSADVENAALAALVPMDFSHMDFGSFQAQGTRTDELTPDVNLVSPGFFETLKIRIAGRAFDNHDTDGKAMVCVVNATLARLLAPNGDVLGRSFSYGSSGDLRSLTVVGVAPDGKYASLGENTEPFLFLPLAQWPRADTSLIVRTALPANTFGTQLRSALHDVDPSQPAGLVHPLSDVLALSLLPQRIAGIASLVLGAIGLLLVAIGLYGIISMYVARRTREFGVRVAMGASPHRIRRDVLRRGASLLTIGLLVGLLLSAGFASLISSLLFGTNVGDLSAFAGAMIVLAAIAMVACWLPARRAMRVNPIEALHHE